MAFTVIGNLTFTGGFTSSWSPAFLFQNNEQGAWYDVSDVNVNWRRNLLTYTEEFDNAVWVKANVTAANTTSITDPLGGTTADTLLETVISSAHRVQVAVTTTAVSYTFSVYVRAGLGRDWVYLRLSNSANTARTAWFDIVNGTVGTVEADLSATITNAGNGWYRCVVTISTGFAGSSTLIIGVTTADNTTNYLGDITKGIYIWGAQLELGSTVTAYQQIVTPAITYVDTIQSQPILYQESTGVTPVTAVEQQVGLILDKSKGLVLGPELVTNGDFSNGTNGWLDTNGAILSIDSDRLKIENTTTISGVAYQIISTVAGRWYKFDGIATNGTTNCTIRVGTTTAGQQIIGTTFVNGFFSIIFAATTTTTYVSIRNDSASIGQTSFWSDISVKEIAGNHAYQAASGSRPTLRSRYNLLTYSEQFDNAAWTKVQLNTTGTPAWVNVEVAPDGTTTAEKLIPNTTVNTHFAGVSNITGATNLTYTVSVYAKAGGYSYLGVSDFTTGQAVFNLQTGVVESQDAGITAATPVNVGNGWWRLQISFVASTNRGVGFDVWNNATKTLFAGNGTDGVFVWGAQLIVTNDLTSNEYQRIASATEYDTDQTKFPVYLQFDGSNDFLQSNSINFTSTDEMTVFAGVRKLSGASYQTVIELSATASTNNGSFVLLSTSGAGVVAANALSVGLRGTAIAGYDATPFAAPYTYVMSTLFDIGAASAAQEISVRVNGAVPVLTLTGAVNAGTGNFGSYPLYIGARAGTSLFLNARIYQLIVRGTATNRQEILLTESYVASKMPQITLSQI